MSPKVYLVNPDIIKRFAEGQKIQRIADVYGVTHNTICRALRSAGIKIQSPRRWSREEERLLIRLQTEGYEQMEIARLMARSWSSINSKLTRISIVNNPELYMRRRDVDYSGAA